jgi:hypothetical protein
MRYPYLLSFLLVLCLNLHAGCPDCDTVLQDKIQVTDRRYNTFHYALELLNQKASPVIVETGTARGGRKNCGGDGCSTIIFADWLKRHKGEFYSVDISQKYLDNAKRGLRELAPFANLICSDSVAFLKQFNKTIDFLYLDSYDFSVNNPDPSQEHHLKEIMAAYPHLSEGCIVMIDDCDLPHGGKGKLVIGFLLDQGWKIIAQSYQVILARN